MKDSSDSEKRDVSRAVVGFRVCIRNRRGFPPRYSGVHRFGWEEFCVDAWFCACAVLFLNHWLPEGCREVLGKNPMTAKLYYVVRLVNREDLLKDDGRDLTEVPSVWKTVGWEVSPLWKAASNMHCFSSQWYCKKVPKMFLPKSRCVHLEDFYFFLFHFCNHLPHYAF